MSVILMKATFVLLRILSFLEDVWERNLRYKRSDEALIPLFVILAPQNTNTNYLPLHSQQKCSAGGVAQTPHLSPPLDL